jgi:hypothetical protein
VTSAFTAAPACERVSGHQECEYPSDRRRLSAGRNRPSPPNVARQMRGAILADEGRKFDRPSQPNNRKGKET